MRSRSLTRPSNLVVTYHYVRPRNSDGVVGITPDELDDQLAAIASHYRIVGVDEFVAGHHDQSGLALITFDDALRDQHEHAWPVLRRRAVPAVFFAPMRPYAQPQDFNAYCRAMGDDRPFRRSPWCTQHLLHALAQELGFDELESRVRARLGEIGVNQDEMNRLYHYEEPRKRWLKYALAFAIDADTAARALHDINASVGLSASDWFCSPDQLLEMQAQGQSLGGHGFDHLPYTTLEPARRDADMILAFRIMERRFGAASRSMSFPFGRCDDPTRELAARLGFRHAFTTDERVDCNRVWSILPRPEPAAASEPQRTCA